MCKPTRHSISRLCLKGPCRELNVLGLAGFDQAEAASYALKQAVSEDGKLDVDLQRLRDLCTRKVGTSKARRLLLYKLFSCSDNLILSFVLHGRHNANQGAQEANTEDGPQIDNPLQLQHVAADFEAFFGGSEDIAVHLQCVLTHTLRKEFPWLSAKAQALTLGILLLLPHIHEVALYDKVLQPLLMLFSAADVGCHALLQKLVSAAPQEITISVVFALQQFLTLRLYSQSSTDATSIAAVYLLSVLHSANAETAHPAPSTIFHNDVINSQDFNLQQDWMRGTMQPLQTLQDAVHPVHGFFSFSHFPFLYGPAAKAQLLRFQVSHDNMQSLNSGPGAMPLISMQLGGGVGSTPMLGSLLALSLPSLLGTGIPGRRGPVMARSLGAASSGQHLLLHVRRGPELLQDALTQIRAALHSDQTQEQSSSLRRPLRVKFADEQGVDEGGPSREFLQLVVRECFSPNFGMFVYDADSRTCWMRASHIHQMLDEFELIGVIVGLAIHNGHTLNLNLAPAIFRKLLGAPLRLEDLRDVHPDVHRSLCTLLQYPSECFEHDMGLTFQVSHEVDFEVANHDLVKDGDSIAVTAANRDEFVREYIQFLLNKRIAPQFEAFERGFYRVCDRRMMRMFESCPHELEQVVCGTQTRDFEELKRSTVYEGHAVDGDTDFIKWFWEVVMNFSETKQRQLLQFVTGNDRAPVGGLGALVPQFKIVKNGEHSNRLPTAHVCFNVLLLPAYENKEFLADRLAKAIENDQGFGLA